MATKAQQYFDLWRDNSNPFDLDRGIIGFARYCFPRIIEKQYGIPEIHLEMYYRCLQMYHSRNIQMLDRQLQFEEARDMAKSTVGSFIFPLYIVCMNGHDILIADSSEKVDTENWRNEIISLNGSPAKVIEDVILIMSETHAMAEIWTIKMRAELSSNTVIKTVFGEMKSNDLRDDNGKWTSTCFRALKNQKGALDWQKGRDVEVVAKGATQQVRGYNTLGRVTLAIFDDLYSQKTVLTVETRQKTRYRVNAEVKNGVDQNKGKMLYIGTKVHEDTIVVDNERNRRVKCIKHCAMDKDQFMYVVNNYCKIDSELRLCHIPSFAKCEELEESGFITNWPERLKLYTLLSQYSEAFEGKQEGKTLSMFWQEKFHETLSEEDKKFKRDAMKDLQFDLITHTADGATTTYVKIFKGINANNEEVYEYRNVNTCIAVDSATSFKTGADDTAMIWMCRDYYGRLYFYKCTGGKFGINDAFISEEFEHEYIDKLCKDRSHIKRIGSTDEIFRWIGETPYRCSFVIETNSVGNEVTRTLYTKMKLYGVTRNVIEVASTKVNKEDRIADALTADFEAGMVYFNSNYNWEVLKNQLEYLGKTSKDDYADAAAVGRVNLSKPSAKITELAKPKEKQLLTIIQKLNLNKIAQGVRSSWST